jgi:transcriptional regulator with XRE-family HTH domain
MCIEFRLCDFVASRRKELGFTQRAVALKLGVTTQHISNIETGRTVPSDRFCLKLANMLRIQPEFMILSNHRERVSEPLKPFFTNAIIDCKRRIGRAKISE